MKTKYGSVSIGRWLLWNIFEKFCHNYVVMKDACHGIMFHAWNCKHAERKGARIARSQGAGWENAMVMPDDWKLA